MSASPEASPPSFPPRYLWEPLVRAALAEDLGAGGDVTSTALLPPDLHGSAQLRTRQPICVAGLELAEACFQQLGGQFERQCRDGELLEPGATLAVVSGLARALLAAERCALNFLQRLSGIATHTQRFCFAVRGTRTAIVDTRKTTPGWRSLEKYAVRCGGGVNHRTGLYDGILIKDNHIAAVGDVQRAVRRARERGPLALRILVEVESVAQATTALEAGADALLVDNSSIETLEAICKLCAGRIPVEATGGIDLERAAQCARAGADRISVGAITHSAPAVDLTLEWDAPSPS